MQLLPPGILRILAALTLLLALACSGIGGPAVKILPNEYSERVSPETIEADRAQCDEIADEVQAEYGPHVVIGDDVFAAASQNFAINNRYKAACLRAKGYDVPRHEHVDLPASAIAKARGEAVPAE